MMDSNVLDSRKMPLAARPGWRFSYSLGTLLCVMTMFCLYHSYRTNQQILKYYTPAPEVDYDSNVPPYKFTDDDFVYPLDPRPATVSLQERVALISDQIARLKTRGELDRAAEMQTRLEGVLKNSEGPYPVDGSTQLHAIGVYQGSPRVRITYKGAPIIVVLCSYDPSGWTVNADPGVQLKKVIVSGYHRQSVQGVPAGVPVEIRSYDGGDRDWFYADTPIEAQAVSARLKKITGLATTTFQTAYEPKGRDFVIGPGNADWTANMTLKALESVHQEAIRNERNNLAQKLSKQTFPDIECTVPRTNSHGFVGTFAMHSIFGPYAKTMRPLDQASAQFAIDPRGPSVFSFIRNQGVVTVDPKMGRLTPWPVAGLADEPHREACLTFDTKRQRLLVWGNDLMAVDILKKEATLVRKGSPAICAMTYSESDDLLYACCATRGSNSSDSTMSEIRTFNQFGAELSRTAVEVPISGLETFSYAGTLKLRVIEDVLLISNLGGYDGNHALIGSNVNYVVDPKSGKLLFACKRQPR